MSVVLHDRSDVLSLRHASSYLLLALAAGAVNAGAFLACERFVTHVTGTVTRIGLDAGAAWTLMVDYALVLVSFIGGAMASVLALQARAYQGKRPLYALPLGVVALVLCATALLGQVGAFGPIGNPVEQVGDFALLCVLAFAMGLMNASVATSTAFAVRTTHMTGPATDFAVSLATAWLVLGEERKIALKLAALRGGKVMAFILGAVVMVPALRSAGYAAFIMPALFVLVATVRSFLPARSGAASREQALAS